MTTLTAAFDHWMADYGQASATDDPLTPPRLFSADTCDLVFKTTAAPVALDCIFLTGLDAVGLCCFRQWRHRLADDSMYETIP